jgi:acetyl/propionyl-CoA carboxylase alpha subunit
MVLPTRSEMNRRGIERLLVANRGEIAVRVCRAAQSLGIDTVAVAPADDQRSVHLQRADHTRLLPGRGAAAYLDVTAVVAAALDSGADAVHPGYGFLSERADLARACEDAGLRFVGPSPDHLARLGDKAAARALAVACGVPVVPGTDGPVTAEQAAAFLAGLGPGAAVMLKAVSGGGGRGMRAVTDPAELADAFERCRSEALAAFGDGSVYAEQLVRRARHIEVQVLGDGTDVIALGDRECTLQRRNQKLVELAPALELPDATRAGLAAAAVAMAGALGYRSLGTFEFLVDAGDPTWFAFIEANARLQVEHTVTEEVTGLDLVGLQLRVAGGARLAEVGLDPAAPPPSTGRAVQLRVNTETMAADGTVTPTGGTLSLFEAPSGPGVRVDTAARTGAVTHPGFDSLLAKVICRAPGDDLAGLFRLARRTLAELRIGGVATNASFLAALLDHPALSAGPVTTRFVEDNAAELAAAAATWAERAAADTGAAAAAAATRTTVDIPDGMSAVRAPMQGTVVSVSVAEGDVVRAGREVAVLESMKMEHVIVADIDGVVTRLEVAAGDTLHEGDPLIVLAPAELDGEAGTVVTELDLDRIRPDLAEVVARHEVGLDEHRPDAVARRRRTGHRTARENVADLVDAGSWTEYGALTLADQRSRFDLDWLVANSPADGMVAGIGTVNAELFGADATQTVVMAYDYTVFAGTQGAANHTKKDRMFDIAERSKLPVVFFAEGGGGRPGADWEASPGMTLNTFHAWGRLSGLVPLVGITTGRCFAGNAAILGCCDVIIATEGSNIGMGGPAMIEGGGLGVFTPEEVGPLDVQVPNGVVDVVVRDETEAVVVAKQYLSYFQGPVPAWSCHDQRELRHVVPENRLRVYDVRRVIELIGDVGSVLELRPEFGRAMVTALARVEGRPVGIIANNAAHLGGAIDGDASDKASRFMQLCDAFGLPLVMLCDTPGIMVGPEVEKTALVRRAARMFVTSANLSVPVFTLVLRKSYGLGALGMAAGGFHTPRWSVSWPSGEFGGMGLEGFVRLGFRREMEAIDDPAERQRFYETKLAELYSVGKALNVATYFELDDVIDPADTRRWVVRGLQAHANYSWEPSRKRRPFVDTW